MKILQVVPYFYPAVAYGGPGKLVYDTSKDLVSRGHTVVVYASDAFDKNQRMPDDKKIRKNERLSVHYFKNFSNSLAFYSNIYLPVLLFFRAVWEIPKFDVIHIHDFYTLPNIWITLIASYSNVPYIVSVHGCLEEERVKQRSLFKRIFLTFFGGKILRSAKYVVATSDNEEKAFKNLNLDISRIIKIGHGVDHREFETTVSKKQARKSLGIPQGVFVFTFLGRIHQIKGLDLLIEAFSKLKKKDTFLIIAGSDEGFLSTVRSLIRTYHLEERTKILGATRGKIKAKLFKASDAFVYPSRSEGFSLGILEAASVGLLLLITKACHFDEIKRKKAGFVCDTTVEALATGLSHILSLSKEERLETVKNIRALIEKKYSMTAIGDELESLYKEASNSQS